MGMKEVVPQMPTAEVSEVESIDESLSLQESIDRAHELYDELQTFNEAEVVGSEAREKVEGIALQLSSVLKNIPASVRLKERLPYHPHESLLTEEVLPEAA